MQQPQEAANWWETAPVVGQGTGAPQQHEQPDGDWWESAPVVNGSFAKKSSLEPQSAFQTATNLAAKGMTFGIGTDLTSGLAHAVSAPLKGDNRPFTQTFQEGVNLGREQEDINRMSHPASALVGDIAGIAGSLGYGGEASPTLMGRMAQNALFSGTLGGIQGAVGTPGDLSNRIEGAAQSAVPSAIMGAAIPLAVEKAAVPAIQALSKIPSFANNAVKGFINPLKSAGREEIAANLQRGIPGYEQSISNLPGPPIKGLNLTPAELSENPNMIAMQRVIGQSSPEDMAFMQKRHDENQNVLKSAIANLRQPTNSGVSSALETASNAAKANERNAWKSIDPNKEIRINTGPLKQDVENYISQLPDAYKQFLPKDAIKVIENMTPGVNFDNYDATRKVLGNLQSKYASGASPDYNRARIIGDIKKIVENNLEGATIFTPENAFVKQHSTALTTGKEPLQISGPKKYKGLNPGEYNDVTDELQQRLAAAKQATKDYHATFSQPDIRSVLSSDKYGFDKVPESAVADKFIRGGRGAKESFEAYRKALNGAPTEVRLQGENAARNVLFDKLESEASGSKPIESAYSGGNLSDTAMTPASFRRAIEKYRHIIDSDLLTKPQRDVIYGVQKSLDLMNQPASQKLAGNSNTPADLMGKKWLDAILGKYSGIALKGAGMVGGAMANIHGPGGAVLGAIAGKSLEDVLERRIYGVQKDKIMELIKKATYDPEFAKALNMKATPANLKMVKQPARGMMEEILKREGLLSANLSSPSKQQKQSSE